LPDASPPPFVGAVDEVFPRLLAGDLTAEPSEAARVLVELAADNRSR